MITEREHWLSITDDPHWQRNHINDPSISLEETVEAVVSAFPRIPDRVLEIGCGYGRLTREINNRWFPDVSVFGLDVNPAVLAEAQVYDPDTLFILGDTIPDLALDAIYSVAVFQHLPDAEKQAYIEQAWSALRFGGVLRVQFIEGDRDNFCDHWVSGDQMLLWCHEAGFTNTRLTSGLVHPQWSWITTVK